MTIDLEPAPVRAVSTAPRQRSRLLLAAAAAALCAVVAWLAFGLGELERYVSPPVDAAGTRISVLAPRGWEGRLSPEGFAGSSESGPAMAMAEFVVAPPAGGAGAGAREWLLRRLGLVPTPEGAAPGAARVRVVYFRHSAQMRDIFSAAGRNSVKERSGAAPDGPAGVREASREALSVNADLFTEYRSADQAQFDRTSVQVIRSAVVAEPR